MNGAGEMIVVTEACEEMRLPRWRLTRWLTHAGKDVPADIRVSLVNSLYGTLPIFAGGVLNTIAVAALVAWRHPSPLFLMWLAIEVTICAARLPVLIACRRAMKEGRRGPVDLYLLLGVLWAAGVGYGSFVSLMSGDWVVAALACLSAAAMVGGICFRNYGAPRLVAAMILLSLGPCAVAGVLSGEPILLITAFQIPFYLASMTIAAFKLNRMLVGTMRAEKENEYRALHDVLTGLLNREGLAREIAARAEARGEGKLTLLYLDLDGFKPINDTYGHAEGDRLLSEVARRLEAAADEGDSVARLGGDEFVIVSSRRSDAAAYGEKVIAAIAGTPFEAGGDRLSIGISVGAALFPDHGGELAELLGAADQALYSAKSRGRSRCVLAGPAAPGLRLAAAG